MRIQIKKILLFAFLFFPVFIFAQTYSDVEVLITEKGFEPNLVEIEKGTKVVWRNEAEPPSWPASDIHPTHTLYPGSGISKCGTGMEEKLLDACRGLEHGEEFAFVFEQAGTWSMHDHLYPPFVMRVNVLGNTDDADEVKVNDRPGFFKKISGILSDFWDFLKRVLGFGHTVPDDDFNAEVSAFQNKEYHEQLEHISELSLQDPEHAWKLLKASFMRGGEIIFNAHQHAHIVGNAAYEKMGFAGVEVCDEVFAYGCFHGVTEKMLFAEGPDSIYDVEKACLEKFYPETSADFSGCIHGTGHGLLSWAGGNIEDALLLCDRINISHRTYCYDGVFMEYTFSTSIEDHEDDLSDNPWGLCSGLEEKYQYNCSRYYVRLMASLFNLNLQQQMALCSNAPNEDIADTCYENLGYDIAHAARGDLALTQELCGHSEDKRGENGCKAGVVTELIFQDYEGWQESTEGICESIIESSWKEKCFDTIKNISGAYNRN